MAHSNPDATYAIAALDLITRFDFARIQRGIDAIGVGSFNGDEGDLHAYSAMVTEIEGIAEQIAPDFFIEIGMPSIVDWDLLGDFQGAHASFTRSAEIVALIDTRDADY